MRLACVIFNYFPSSGLARDCLRIVRCAQRRNHTVTLFTQNWQGPRPQDLDVRIINSGGISNHAKAKRFYLALQQQLAQQHDLVLGFNKLPDLDFYYAGDDCFVAKAVTRSFWYRLTPRFRQYARFEHAVCAPNSATQIFCLSDKQRSDFRCFHLTPDHRLHPLPPNLDPAFKPAPADAAMRGRSRAALDIEDDHVLMLMVGSGYHTKGVDRAIQALANLPATLKNRTHLLIAGQGDSGPLLQLAQHLNVARQVRFLGVREDVAELLRAADILLHPARREAGGAILLEALVSGVPVLTLSVCGHATYIEQAQAGTVLPEPFRQGDLDHALASMLQGDLQTWGEQGLRYAKDNDFTAMAEHVVDKLEDEVNAAHQTGDLLPDVYLKEPLRSRMPKDFAAILTTSDEVCREAHARRTSRFECAGQNFFIKAHFGVGWREIFKNWVNRRAPVVGAENEWYALHRLPQLAISTARPAGFGSRGLNPARRRSFVIAEQVDAVSLEDILLAWKNNPSSGPDHVRLKRRLIKELARIARQLHDSGLNHQDFYLCHFWMVWPGFPKQAPPDTIKIYLMDLHRVQQRRMTSPRWRRKDLGGLYFSTLALRPSKTDRCRFIKYYQQQTLRDALGQQAAFWQAVAERALKLDKAHENHLGAVQGLTNVRD